MDFASIHYRGECTVFRWLPSHEDSIQTRPCTVDKIRDAIAAGELPTRKEDLLGTLIQSDGSYVHQEGLYWDFKRDW